MKHYAKLVFIATLALVKTSCSNGDTCNNGKTIEIAVPQKTTTYDTLDTLRVTGVFNWSGRYYNTETYKIVNCVDKHGTEYTLKFNLGRDFARDEAYVERGDTIVVEEGKLVENLTQKRIANEFVRGK